MSSKFSDVEYWKAIILYGLNSATYKIALAKTLLKLGREEQTAVSWDHLAQSFLDQYITRLDKEDAMPQQSNPSRLTKMERIVKKLRTGNFSYEEAVTTVAKDGFNDVIPRFHTIGTNSDLISEYFYSYDFGNELVLHDSLLEICDGKSFELQAELEARWSLLEGAFMINHDNWDLANDLRNIYLQSGHKRKNLTDNIPFLQAYQGNRCFYCGEPIEREDIHVDHVLPRQVLNHDQEWNLVLSHSFCNIQKGDKLVGKHFINKLIQRNENLIGSNHPWKNRIKQDLGNTKKRRSKNLSKHYDNVKEILGPHYWSGVSSYNPTNDPFYRKLITKLNNA